MGECQWINGGMWILLVMVLSFWLVEAQDDYSGNIYIQVSTSKAGHYWPASETPLEWRFAGGPILAPELY